MPLAFPLDSWWGHASMMAFYFLQITILICLTAQQAWHTPAFSCMIISLMLRKETLQKMPCKVMMTVIQAKSCMWHSDFHPAQQVPVGMS